MVRMERQGYMAGLKDSCTDEDIKTITAHLTKMGIKKINHLKNIGVLLVASGDDDLDDQAKDYLETLDCVSCVDPNLKHIYIRPPMPGNKRDLLK